MGEKGLETGVGAGAPQTAGLAPGLLGGGGGSGTGGGVMPHKTNGRPVTGVLGTAMSWRPQSACR